MRTLSRKGLKITLNSNQFIRQDQIDLGHEIYYVIYREDGSSVELKEALPGLVYNLVDKKPKPARIETAVSIPETIQTLPKAEDCPSAGEGKWCPVKAPDPYADEKYKGETFYTHKSAPGLVIKHKDQVIHETKMGDMYKRRD